MRLISHNGRNDFPYEHAEVSLICGINDDFRIIVETFGNDEPYVLAIYKKELEAKQALNRMREAYDRGDKYFQFKNATT